MNIRTNRGALSLGGAIIIAGALIAIAVIYINRPTKNAAAPATTDATGYSIPAQTGMLPVTAEDHILGNPNAPIKLVEYSDLSCPYCKLFNPTMERVMNTYGPGGKVAWVYRQLPIYKPDAEGHILHPNSGVQAEAIECVASLGGNRAFFAFLSNWFGTFPTDGASRSAAQDKIEIAAVAKESGVDPTSFNKCLTSGRMKAKVEQEYSDSLAAGITGTPFTYVITPTGNTIPLEGIQDFATLKNIIDTLLTTVTTDDTTATPK